MIPGCQLHADREKQQQQQQHDIINISTLPSSIYPHLVLPGALRKTNTTVQSLNIVLGMLIESLRATEV